MRPVCPRCNRRVHVKQHTEKEPRKRSKWLITTCTSCGFNFDLEKVKGEIEEDVT